jgi:nicotinamidase-related amidase
MSRQRTALLILDMITDFGFEDGARLLRRIRPVARRIAALRQRAARTRVPVIYVNDHQGRWRPDVNALLRHCTAAGRDGSDVARLLAPAPPDYFIFKPRHSGFYGSALEPLLAQLGATKLVLTGVSSHQCVLFTANDAYVREYELHIPRDCIGAPDPAHTRLALKYFDLVLGADTRPSSRFRMARSQLRARPR